MKRVAILQSNYIPWKGYFDMIAAVDEFIIYDDVQFTKNDWRNRNKLKTPQGVQWISIPVRQGQLDQKINETRIADRRWPDKHWKMLKQNYSRAPCFSDYSQVVADAYQEAANFEMLSEVNLFFIRALCRLMNIRTRISLSSDYKLIGGRIERLVSLCEQAGAGVYLSGPAAKSYLDESFFYNSDIKVEWMDYSGYPEYPQLYPPFEHGVSMMDLLFNAGPKYSSYMKFAQ